MEEIQFVFIVFFVLLVFILKRFDFVEIISLEEKKFGKKNMDVGSLLGVCFDWQYCYIIVENNCNDFCLFILLNGLIFFYCLIQICYKY